MEENRRPCSLPDEKKLQDLADLFKVFGDATRIRILLSMYDGERAVSEIADAVGMSTSAVSHQLKILRSAGLVRARRDGKQIFYSLADEHVHTIIGVGRDHIEE
ncbi:MAG: metalloregulator ArsR/SmtB family transcription factor [Lachnospiraceae bacterium]|jgi:ArsR family transcriptional regulator|nr:metalloregulator ArsR/SmtB family transcription factor [Lachnospiraceae bacterium]MCI1397162.1 metalloregulator ArsR/SmtB family transcription factor [Lachnospiraceae bacterium]MCI1422800.1 metalloregulator ArsR/SmtB family transcription factor [Lachnospiraceae bacterium]MCI1451511.1 metalloregulator ArsR/SmtB family transcription factor [Lachnospiraceae bacterium]